MYAPDFGSRPTLYRPLDIRSREIRLLTIDPSSNSSGIVECHIVTCELAKHPPFYALSYVWGNSKVTDSILLEGQLIQVTSNLFSALTKIRESTYELPDGVKSCKHLWVDALCINQKDYEEKNRQVPMMRDIYKEAELVIMWLGEEDQESGRVVSLIEQWSNAARNAGIVSMLEAETSIWI